MGVTHKAKAGALLTGTEYEASDAHTVSIAHADLDTVTADQHHATDHDHDGSPTQQLAQANTHESADTDSGTSSLHHTIGTGANQSAAGDHSHAGGGLTQAYVGYNTAGGSTEGMATSRVYLKQVTIANDCLITDIEAYVRGTDDQVTSFGVVLMSDSSGNPDLILSFNDPGGANKVLLDKVAGAGGYDNPRWLGKAIGYWVTAGDYWIGVVSWDSSETVIYYDGSGADKHIPSASNWLADNGFYTLTGTSNKYSIRANTIR